MTRDKTSPEPDGTASLPRHVAVIMDGNGRWAQSRGLTRLAGHEQGAHSVRRAVKLHRRLEIPFLTLFAFSTENWGRPKSEVSGLMDLLAHWAEQERAELIDQRISMHLIGQPERLSAHALESLLETVRVTHRTDPVTTLTLALSYGGRSEIARAAAALARDVRDGTIEPELLEKDQGEELFARYLDTAPLPDPDLVIRTGGNVRISNFLLFQSAYSEWFFHDEPWPTFGDEHFFECFERFSKSIRRYGLTSEQVLRDHSAPEDTAPTTPDITS